ncbi:MOSC domain-containing protein [Haloplanus pelagicus]|jgi:MOSC domain-containing protein YiiM|uniref:MOSC domain-containing protein n=1 Tax=Haloplanus pelagicus TaxID=2949995 RepID=UPI00203B030A|nr:MOSC domain-containing protein [Haloplanus sp. HW8-1]
MARVTDVFVAPDGSAPMESVDRVEAIADGGLRGDRYCTGEGHYAPYDTCQVTLVAAEAIAEIERETGIDLTDGRHRRNVVVEGIDVHELLDHRVRVGGATLVGTRPRPPCAHVEDLADEAGVARALGDGRGGICADVVEGGPVAVGDTVTDLGSRDRTDAVVDRLRSEE